MQDVDCPAHVQTLAQPARGHGPRVQIEPLRLVPLSQVFYGIAGHLGRRWDLRQKPAVRAVETKFSTRFWIELIALFVDGTVVAATQKDEIRECRRAALGPVTDVMTLAEADSAAGEPTASVPMVERAS